MILYLNGVEILAAADYNVFFTVNEIDKSVLVLLSHISREQPIALEYLVCRLGILVIAFHNAVALDCKLTDLATSDLVAVFVEYLGLPKIARFADSAYLMYVFNPKVYATGTDRLGKTVVGIVVVGGELLFPTLDKRGRNGLSAYVHKSPLRESVVLKLHVAPVDAVENVLNPRNEQPYYRSLFVRRGLEHPFGLYAAEEYRFAAREQRSEPVHLCARVVERRNAEENVVLGLRVMLLLGVAGGHECLVPVKYRLRKSCCSRGEVYSSVVLVAKLYGWNCGRAVVGHLGVVVGVRRGVGCVSNEEKVVDAFRDLVGDSVDTADKLGTEHEHSHVGEVKAVFDLV